MHMCYTDSSMLEWARGSQPRYIKISRLGHGTGKVEAEDERDAELLCGTRAADGLVVMTMISGPSALVWRVRTGSSQRIIVNSVLLSSSRPQHKRTASESASQ